MFFNSIDFAFFLPIVFILFWYLRGRGLFAQNLLIVVASYVFYGWWDSRFLGLLFLSTGIDFLIGRALAMQANDRKRRVLIIISISFNLGMLGFFKYYDFFIENFNSAFTFFGGSFSLPTLRFVLPVGISFYTFQTLSYTVDVYHKKLTPTTDFIAFMAFVSFFPQLVAGPIERATHLLPQFQTQRIFDYRKAIDGLRQSLWGLFKKIVIADNCAEWSDIIFDPGSNFHGSTLLVGAFLFSFQIYCDFSGYSDIAVGVARLFGFDLMRNFAFPYFSRDIAEFWRRWHISLSTWFRDYLYIPLGGNKGSLLIRIRNTFVIFVVSGFWHGANWTFIFWGLLNALYFLPLLITKRNRKFFDPPAINSFLPSFSEVFMITLTFMMTTVAWIFFRSESVSQAFKIIHKIFSFSFFTFPEIRPSFLFALLTFFLIIEWSGRKHQHALAELGLHWNRKYRVGFYYLVILLIFLFTGRVQEFIYFQF